MATGPLTGPRCMGCAACCYLPVVLRPGDDVPADLVARRGTLPVLRRREDGSCAALDRASRTCTIYDQRPATCRGFPVDGATCRRVRAQPLA
jgi:Fe-S-cluster containining protein